MSFTEIERLIDRYDAATTALDQAVTDRISKSMDAAFRQMVRELERQYPRWASQGSLYASQRRLLLLNELGPLLAIVRPEDAAAYESLLAETLQLSHTTGATLADELVKVRDPGYPLQDFATIPIEAAVAQARDGVGRLSRYSDEFRQRASGIVEQGLIQGFGTKRVQQGLEQELGVAKGKAETLARTEVMSALNTAATERYQRNGIQWQQWISTPAESLCPICAARHGNVYKVGEASMPAHPRCRCVWLPFNSKWQQQGLTDDAAIAKSRAAIVAEFEAQGGQLDTGPTYWEKKAGLTAAPRPVWKPGDAVARVGAAPPAPRAIRANTMSPINRSAPDALRQFERRQQQVSRLYDRLASGRLKPGPDDDDRTVKGKMGALNALGDAQNPKVGLAATRNEAGEYTGFLSFKPGRREVEIENLGTDGTQPGAGRALFQEVVSAAARDGKGIVVAPVPSAIGFYEKMGMRRVGDGALEMSPEEVQRAAVASAN